MHRLSASHVLLMAIAAVVCGVQAQGTMPWQRLPLQVIEGRPFRHYATVERSDGTSRKMFLDEASLRGGTPLPDGAFFVMETYYSPDQESTNFTKERKKTGFEYGSFSPNRPSFNTRPDSSCSACHRSATDALGTFTQPMLEAARKQGRVMLTTCNQGGRTPCAADVYNTFRPQ